MHTTFSKRVVVSVILSALCLESCQQTSSRTVRVVVLPIAEIADMLLPADRCGPGLAGVHDSVVDPDRERHEPLFPVFAFNSRFDFLADPAARN